MGEGIIGWFTRNRIAANLLMASILVWGLTTLPSIKKEVFPEFSANIIQVGVTYPGATPEEAEEAICSRIEEQVQGLDGVKQITSTATEGAGAVSIEVLPEADLTKVLNDVKTRVDAIDTFPIDAEKPIVQEVVLRKQVISIAVHGEIDETARKRIGERVRDEVSALPGITQVELKSARPYEISIEVAEDALRRHGLTFDQVANAVRRTSLDLPAGAVKADGGEILVRTKGQAYRGPEFEDLVVLTRADGTRLLLRDVATIVDGFAETDEAARFDGRPAVLVQVYRVGNQDALGVADAVHAYVAEAQARMPEGVTLTTWQDDSAILRSRIDLLVGNSLQGLVLVFLTLALFLRMKLAFWVAMGIPVSFLGAVALMPTFDVSINMISLFAFLVVLGIVVDDAIVVGENVHEHQSRNDGVDRTIATIRGSREVAVSVTFGVLTTVAAFLPMFNVEGAQSKIWRVIPLVVIPVLLFSLVESKLILPAHLAHMKPPPARPRLLGWPWWFVQQGFHRGLRWFVQNVYRPVLEAALRARYLTVAVFVAILMTAIGFVAGGRAGFVFFPQVEGDNVVAVLQMPQGTPVARTEAAVRQIEAAALAVDAEMSGGSVVKHVLASVASQPYRNDQNRNAGQSAQSFSGSHLGEVNVQLLPSEQRTTTAEQVLRLWREKTGAIDDATELTFTSSLFSAGDDIDVQLASADIEQLQQAANELKAHLAGFTGVFDITDSFVAGKDEIELDIKPRAEALGLSTQDLARQVRQAFYGEEAQRIQRGRDDVKVMVRYPAEDRRSLHDLESMRIRTAQGDEIPFVDVANATHGSGYASIRRTDRRRTLNVTGAVDKSLNNPNQIVASLKADFLPQLAARYPGLRYSFEGEQKSQQETLGGLARGFLLALFLIYALMAIPLKSYVQPLIIMTAIPFGFVGAILGHMVLGIDLSIMSMFGLVALAGVAVNDSLVMIEFVNTAREKGKSLFEAVHDAGIARFRAILLTSLTTAAGLTPLILEKSVQAKFLIPMAVSLGFGVMFATFVTLLLVPCLYMVLHDVMNGLRGAVRYVYAPSAPRR